MGGGGPVATGKSGKKQLDSELNLVPFIDLLCCTIAFLLITAVWTQLARINVSQKGQGQAGEATEQTPPEVKIVIVVDETGFKLSTGSGNLTPIPKKDTTTYDYEKLQEELTKLKKDYPDKNDLQIASEDQIKYEFLVQTMDAALNAKFQDIALTDVGAAAI
jgi:biopolymer transport protein TolR